MQRTRYSARGDVDGVTSCSRSNFQRACAGDAYPPPAPSRAPAQRQFANAVGLGFLTMSIAHEVNQPLSGIITNASTYIRMLDADPANLRGVRETVQRTIRDAYRCAEVIARLRALVVREEGACGSLDLNATARDAIADCAAAPESVVDHPRAAHPQISIGSRVRADLRAGAGRVWQDIAACEAAPRMARGRRVCRVVIARRARHGRRFVEGLRLATYTALGRPASAATSAEMVRSTEPRAMLASLLGELANSPESTALV